MTGIAQEETSLMNSSVLLLGSSFYIHLEMPRPHESTGTENIEKVTSQQEQQATLPEIYEQLRNRCRVVEEIEPASILLGDRTQDLSVARMSHVVPSRTRGGLILFVEEKGKTS